MKLAIASGKGGTGKTTLATNLARLWADRVDRRERTFGVCYVDCDVEAPNGHLFLNPRVERTRPATVLIPQIDQQLCDRCGECQEACRFNALAVLEAGVLTFPELCHGCGACRLACPLGAITETAREIGTVTAGAVGSLGFLAGRLNVGEPMPVPLIRELHKSLPDTMHVVYDAPPGTACAMVETVAEADFTVLVTEPTPFGLNDLRLAVLTVRELGVPFGVVINREGLGDDRVVRYCADEGVELLGTVPDDRRIAEAYSRGELIADRSDDLRRPFDSLLDRLLRVEKTKTA